MSILSDRTDQSRFAGASILFPVSVALVAAISIVLFSIASTSLLGARKETPTQSRSHDSHLEGKVAGAIVSHMDSDASPASVQTKSPSASDADNMLSSTPILPFAGTLTEETLAAPALNPTPNGEASTQTVATSNGSAPAPSADEPPPPERSPSHEVGASYASIAEGAPTVEMPNGSAPAPSADETPPPGRSPSHEVEASRASIAEGAPTVEIPNGSTRTPSTDETPPPGRSPSHEMGASHASVAEGAPTVEIPSGSAPAPSADDPPPPERSPSHEVGASHASVADAANPVQEASGATISTLAISHEQRDQIYRDSEMQRHHDNIEEGSLAFAPKIDFFKKTTIQGSTGFYGSSAGPALKPPMRHAGSRGRGSIANKLNHAELSRLVQRSGALR